MYEVFKSVISAGGFKLAEIQYKVKKLYVTGDRTEEQMDGLLKMAVEGISPDAERPEVMQMLRSLSDRLEAVEKMLEDRDGTDDPVSEYDEWRPWDGISHKYQQGEIVKHGDQLWQSVHNGQNVWEPGTPGTEALWVAYEEV